MQGTFELNVDEYKQVKSLARENLRDHMTDIELILTMLGEATTTKLHRDRDSQGIAPLKKDAQDATNNNANALSWLPFHFLPGYGNHSGESVTIPYEERLICLPDSPVARAMMASVISSKSNPMGTPPARDRSPCIRRYPRMPATLCGGTRQVPARAQLLSLHFKSSAA